MTVGKEELLYRELRELRSILERIEALLEERLIGIEEPLSDEVEAIKEYEIDKKRGKVELVDLEDVLRGLK
ncbi:MAG: hypothetical protein GSR86_03670 [Desulfurococcales archaeon]|nr:hypothetical protein [Desulfurococcales archaeon]